MSSKRFVRLSKHFGPGWQLIRTRNFGLLWSSQALSQVGDGLIKIALLWFVYTLTGSAFKMTVIGLLQTIPPLVFGPLIGVYLDRLQKKPVMIGVNLVRAGFLILIPLLHARQMLSLELLYLLVFVIAMFSAIFGPALSSVLPLMVPRSHLTAANAVMQSTATLGVLLGPAFGGPAIALIGPENVLYLGAPAFVIGALLLIPTNMREQPVRPAKRWALQSPVHDMKVGLRYLFIQQASIRLMMTTAALHGFVAGAFVFLLPVYAARTLSAGPVELGWLWSAYGVGMLMTSVWLTLIQQGTFYQRWQIISWALAAGGLAACSLGLMQALIVALALVTIVGGSLALFTPVVWGLLQELTPQHLLGRIFTLFSSGAMCATMAGMLAFGWSADALGPKISLVAMGLVLLGTSITATLARPRKVAGTMRSVHLRGR